MYWEIPIMKRNIVNARPIYNHSKGHLIAYKVAKHYQVPFEVFMSRKRGKGIVFPRQVAMWMIKRFDWSEDVSLERVGFVFKRNHATVIHGIKQVDNIMSCYFRERQEINELLTELKTQIV